MDCSAATSCMLKVVLDLVFHMMEIQLQRDILCLIREAGLQHYCDPYLVS